MSTAEKKEGILSDAKEALEKILSMDDPEYQAEACRRIISKVCAYESLSGELSPDLSEQVMLLTEIRDVFLKMQVSGKKTEAGTRSE